MDAENMIAYTTGTANVAGLGIMEVVQVAANAFLIMDGLSELEAFKAGCKAVKECTFYDMKIEYFGKGK